MAVKDQAFEERLNNEYDLRGRAKLATILSAILFLSFLGLDAHLYTPIYPGIFYHPVHGFFGAPCASILVYQTHTNRGYTRLGMALVLIDAAGIAFMIQFLGGFLNQLLPRLTLIVIGMVVVIPLAFRETLILYTFIWASYAVPSFISPALASGDRDWRVCHQQPFFSDIHPCYRRFWVLHHGRASAGVNLKAGSNWKK